MYAFIPKIDVLSDDTYFPNSVLRLLRSTTDSHNFFNFTFLSKNIFLF